MFRMLVVIILAALLWSGAWFWGAGSNKTRITTWMANQQQAGYAIRFSDLTQLGFPNRYDVTLENPTVSGPQLGIDWHSDFIQIMRLSYEPEHFILVWPNTQQVTFNNQRLDLRHQGLKASLVTHESGQFRLSAEAGETMLSSSDRLWLKLEQWQFSLAETRAGAKVFLRLKNIEQTDGAQLSDMRLLFEISGRTVHYGRLLPQLRPNESFEISNIKLIVDDADIPLEGWLSLGSEIGLSGQLKTEPKHLEILASLFGALLPGNPLDLGLSRAGLTIIADENAVLD